MPRSPRADEAGGLYHALNRGNLRATIFHKEEENELASVRLSAQRGRPLGDDNWVESIARRLDLESTLRPRGHKQVRFPNPKNNKEA